MKITVRGKPKEIAALVVAVQERQPKLEIIETPESHTTRYGNTEVVQTKDAINGLVL